MDEQVHPEIIIVKRRSNHEEEHHGGAWKIAFADFMTAMMAFFLVLWIISATDKNTKTIIARYFNPVKIEESARTPKSIHGDGSAEPSLSNPGVKTDADQTEPGDANTELPPEGRSEASKAANGLDKIDPSKAGASVNFGDPSSPKPTMSEGVLFSDPYRSLDIIAGAGSPNALAILQRDKAEGGAADEEGLADPFRPLATRPANAPPPPDAADLSKPPTPVSEKAAQDKLVQDKPAQDKAAPLPVQTPQLAQTPPTQTAQTSPPQTASATPPPPASAVKSAASDAKPAPSEAKPLPSEAKPLPSEAKPTQADADRLQRALELQTGALGGKQLGPAIDVKATDEGLLITLTDKLNFSMFAIGSAEPQPQVIKAMDAVASILKTRPGAVIVRGHTDGHPYRSTTYDNWRLSSARAQMAYYMLTRAGLPESRFERIEGYADKRLRDPAHPFAAENRRIEILLREPKP